MFDGVVRDLTNVRHVPEHRKNLISVGVLNYLAKCEAVRLAKVWGQNVGNLYRLVGNIVVDGAVVSMLVDSCTDDTQLWHIWLGHIGKRGMLELHKKNLLKGMKMCKLEFCKYSVYIWEAAHCQFQDRLSYQ